MVGCILKNNPSTIRRDVRETKEGWFKRSCAAFSCNNTDVCTANGTFISPGSTGATKT